MVRGLERFPLKLHAALPFEALIRIRHTAAARFRSRCHGIFLVEQAFTSSLGLGIVLGDDIEGDYSTLAQLRDPDGNLLTLATPPSRPYPPT